jgi:hypothetical protein
MKRSHGIPAWVDFATDPCTSKRVHFWPFDGWDIPAGRSAVTEVYPALWSRSFARADRTGDRGTRRRREIGPLRYFEVHASNPTGRLASFLKPGLMPPERAVAQVEGWILGVA